MAQCMWGNILFDSGHILVMLYKFPKTLARHSLAVHIDKQRLFGWNGYQVASDIFNVF